MLRSRSVWTSAAHMEPVYMPTWSEVLPCDWLIRYLQWRSNQQLFGNLSHRLIKGSRVCRKTKNIKANRCSTQSIKSAVVSKTFFSVHYGWRWNWAGSCLLLQTFSYTQQNNFWLLLNYHRFDLTAENLLNLKHRIADRFTTFTNLNQRERFCFWQFYMLLSNMNVGHQRRFTVYNIYRFDSAKL